MANERRVCRCDGDGEEQLNNTINTTPLVDVMLVLLIIFLITIPVVTQSIDLKLPNERNLPTQTKPENIVIAVNRDGEVYWGLERMADNEALVNRLKIEAVKEPQPEVHIRGDQEVRYESVGRVVVACQRAGIFKVGFITEPPAGGATRLPSRRLPEMGMNVGNSGGGDDDGDVMVDINTTPLIDVMLVLLIMFIITIPIQTHAVKMNMPGAQQRGAAADAADHRAHRRRLRRHHRLERRNHPGRRPWCTIEQRLHGQVAAQADQPEVHLRPNKLVIYKHVAMIMATAQRLGVTKIGIVG